MMNKIELSFSVHPSTIQADIYLLSKFEQRMPPMMSKPKPRTAWIVAKKVTRMATPGTALLGDREAINNDDFVSDNQVIYSYV